MPSSTGALSTEVLFAVRDWHRSADCIAGADAVATGCVRVTEGTSEDDPLIALDPGITWPFGTHTMQLHTATVLRPGGVTLLGELDKFVPLSSKRFTNVSDTAGGGLTVVVVGKPGEEVHVTALRPRGAASWVVARDDVTIGATGVAMLQYT